MELKKLTVLHILMALVFCLSGLVINCIQCVLYLSLYNINRKLYRKINYYLIYSSWSQVVAMAEWWSESSCTIYSDSEETFEKFGTEHTLIVMNHKYDLDWLMCWMVCDKLGMLGNAKTCAKTSLRYLPVIGWGWVFAEMVFLDRNWEKDSLSLGDKLDKLFSYEDPVMLLLFSEGTRFTSDKHKASMKFAESHNLKTLKHHLLPRTKGFNFAASRCKNTIKSVYDVQLAFPTHSKPTTFFSVLRGEKFCGDMYIRRIPMTDIPTESDEDMSAWLHNLYQEKDKVMDDYLNTNKFPGIRHKMVRRAYPLLNAFFWILAVGLPCCYLILQFLTCGVFWVQAVTITGLVLLSTIAYMMIGVTKSDKGSSYGKSDSSAHENGATNGTVNSFSKNSKTKIS